MTPQPWMDGSVTRIHELTRIAVRRSLHMEEFLELNKLITTQIAAAEERGQINQAENCIQQTYGHCGACLTTKADMIAARSNRPN